MEILKQCIRNESSNCLSSSAGNVIKRQTIVSNFNGTVGKWNEATTDNEEKPKTLFSTRPLVIKNED
jgi:hypothetical protein